MSQPQRFGQYILLERISAGGMAEIFRAKADGIRGFEKLLAIKRIHPKLSEEEKFIKMMVDEAKISVRLNHVNIAQIFDLGQIDGMYYIAMEYIHGRDLFKVMRRCQEREIYLPIEAAVFIAHELCAGLDYAHTKRDEANAPLGIIHRDVSPQNVIISFEGQVKLVDFGIAKHTSRSGQTDAGIIKGKFSYMSPEQAWGDPIDHRTDIFSTGIMLWEMLTGTMLYNESEELKLLDRIRKADTRPPRSLRPDLPRELDALVMKALVKRLEARYQTAHEFQNALARFLYSRTKGFGVAKMSQLMRELFPEEAVQKAFGKEQRDAYALGFMSREEFPARASGSLLEDARAPVEATEQPSTHPVSDPDEPTRVWERRRAKKGELEDYEETSGGESADGYEKTGARRKSPGVAPAASAPSPAKPAAPAVAGGTGEYEVLDGEELQELPPSQVVSVAAEPTVVDAVSPFFEGPAPAGSKPLPATPVASPREVPPWEKPEGEFTNVFTPPAGKAAPVTVGHEPKRAPAPVARAAPEPRPAAAPVPARPATPWREETPAHLWDAAAAAPLMDAPEPAARSTAPGPWMEPRPLPEMPPRAARPVGRVGLVRRRRAAPALFWVGAILLLGAGAVAIWYGLQPSEEATPRGAPPAPARIAGPEPRELAPVVVPAPPQPTPAAAPDAGPPAVAVVEPQPPPPPREEIKPAAKPARLQVSSKPLNADVYIDGRKKGKTGRWFELTAGKSYEIQVRKRGYQTTEDTIEATEGDERLSVTLKPARGPARRPPKKKIAKATPPEPTPAGAVEPKEETKEEPKPEPPQPPPAEPGLLNVNARPWGEVHIDGSKVADQTPFLGHSLRPGVHRVRVFFVSSQKFSEERKVQIKSGQTQTLLFKE